MRSKMIHSEAGQKTFVLIFATGDEVMRLLTNFAREQRLAAAHFTAIGAFERGVIG